jgi:hypothetical protein
MSPTHEWNKKMWYSYIMEFYSATTKNEMLSFASKWMKLENIILSEVKQFQCSREEDQKRNRQACVLIK